jgi:hypothetical protein
LDEDDAYHARLEAGIVLRHDGLDTATGQTSSPSTFRKRGPQDSGKGVRVMVWLCHDLFMIYDLKGDFTQGGQSDDRLISAGGQGLRLQVWSHMPLVPAEDTVRECHLHSTIVWSAPYASFLLQELPNEPTW